MTFSRSLAFALLLVGCSSTEVQPETNATSDVAVRTADAPARTASATPEVTATASASAALPSGSFACGKLTCEIFESPQAAFSHIVETDKPLVLALGESHAQKGSESVRSTTSRFTDDLLPKLEGKASSLVLELWVADGKCGKAKEQEVAQKQKVVTENQAASNQNEFVTLGEKSKSLKIVPFILRPTCEEYDVIRKAGDNAVLEMLSMITRNMRDKAKSLFDETAKKAPGKMVVTYGGALHNDRVPREGREQWSFAKDLDTLSGGRYVELDLVVPEFIKDNESWKSLPWFDSYDKARFATATVVITTGPRSYALIFPSTTGH
ncbi:MAG: hypothetical protein HOW73_47245 [Polyangiaceae bacterium]|nr:hypothetical protein [Polyangiaceae bacterium]